MSNGKRQLLADMARLQALYVLRLWSETGRSLDELIATQTPWRSQLPSEGASLPEFVQCAAEILSSPSSEADRADRLVEFADPLFAEGIGRTAEADRNLRWFGSFRFAEHPGEGAISLHIANRGGACSPFEDMKGCFECLRDLCTAVETLTFPVSMVTCGTWLNDRPDFLSLFPASYRNSLQISPPDGKTGLGWWGQFVDRRGQLHRRRADQLLKTGSFPHSRKDGKCDFHEFKAHVAAGAYGAGKHLILQGGLHV